MKLSRRPVLHGGHLRWRAYWTAEGKSRKRFFRSKADAEDFLDGLRKERAAFGAVWTDLPALERVALVEALRRAQRGGYSLPAACEHFERTHAPKPVGDGKEWTVAKLVAEVMAAKRAKNLRPRSLAALERTLDLFQAEHGLALVRKIQSDQVAAFIRRPGWSPRTQRGALVDVSTMFSWAVRQGRLARNPCDGVDRPLVDDKPVTLLTTTEGERLMRTAEQLDPELIGGLALALFLGLRPESEIGRLSRADVERALAVGELSVTRGKIRSRGQRAVPVRPNARAWLERWLALGCEVQPSNLKRRWETVRTAAGWGQDNPWPADAARHTFASAVFLIEGGAVAAREAGHSEEMAVRHYRGRMTETEARDWFTILPDPAADYVATAKARAATAANKRRLSPEQMAELARRRWGTAPG
jgi:hypothetical protein